MIDGSKRGLMQVKDVRSFLDSVLDEDIHTKRIASLANATLGVMTGASLGVAVIGQSLARLRGLDHFRGFGPLKINELIKKVFTTAGAGARAAEWSLGRDLGIADQRESAEGACERQSDTFRLSWQ